MDMGYWYVYLPLRQLGHEVYFYDTVEPKEKDYKKIIETLKPDLIYCCLTGDKSIAPYEPWSEILNETNSGRTKTFNWFCDDTWRFDNFSSKACSCFNVCSTPEPAYIEKFKSIGYNKIILGPWHVNAEFYPKIEFKNKDIDISFIGNLTPTRKAFFDAVEMPIKNIFGISHEELFLTHAKSKIGINLSTNDNDTQRKTQMKQRMFEIAAGSGLLFTEYHDAIENFYEIDKEIVTFKTIDEFNKKAKFLLKTPKLVEQIAQNGYRRFLAEHDSKVRLEKVLKEINKC
jgi:spore maturation protein CgeB